MNTVYKVMIEMSLLERIGKVIDNTDLLTKSEKHFLLDEVSKVVETHIERKL